MGKIRKPKRGGGAIRYPGCLISQPSTLTDNESQFEISGPIEAICRQLQNSADEEKLNGLQSLSVLSLNKQKADEICRSGLIRIASPLLCEENVAVRDAAAGALRNLSVCGEEYCGIMVDNDVLTPLLTLIFEYVQNNQWKPDFDINIGNQMDLRSDVFLQAINILRNLCEYSPTAIESFNQSQILDGLFRCLDIEIFGVEIAVSVGQCILVVSENNQKSWKSVISNAAFIQCLIAKSGNHSNLFLASLAAGILSNVPAMSAELLFDILKATDRALIVDCHSEFLKLKPMLEHLDVPRHQQLDIDMDVIDDETDEEATIRRRRQDLPSESEIALKEFGYLIDAQKLAVEIISNFCSSEEENWYDDEQNSAESDHESIVEFKINETENRNNKNEFLPVEVAEPIKSMELVKKIWQKAQSLDENFHPAHTLNDIQNKWKNMRISSLLCLQNLCASFSLEDLGGPEAIYNVWVDLGKLVFKSSEVDPFVEPITSLMRATLKLLQPHREFFNQMTLNDMELILGGIDSCVQEQIRTNWLSMLGTLGNLLSEHLVKIIIIFLLDTCKKEDDVYIISEALDSLMNIFSTNDWDQIVVEINLLESMKLIENQFKCKVRQQRRQHSHNMVVVQTAKLNISRFVKYIESILSKN